MDLLSLINTNDAPTESQAREIHRLLEAGQNDLKRIEDATLKVSLILSELQFQKRQRTKSLPALRRILSPIRRLPSELLAEIFLFCRADSMSSSFSILDVRKAPMLLSHVAAHWRAVSIGTPMLWDTPCFRYSIVPGPKAIYMRTILQRSLNLPTSLSFETSGTRLSISAGNTDCFQFFADLSDRLHHISLDLAWDVREHAENPPPSPLFPILASLEISLESDEPGDLPTIMNSFRRAPGLRALGLWAYSSPFIPTYDFPWIQLTSLTMSIPIDDTTVYLILRQCIQLEICALFEMSFTGDTQDSQPLCTLDALRSFSFTPWDAANSGKLIEFFSFPKLESLSLENCGNLPATVILDLRARSDFRLQDLTLSKLSLTTGELLEILHHLPSLKTLLLEQSTTYIVDDLLRAFTYHSQSHARPLILPCLTTLTIRHNSKFLTGSVVADMVESLARHAGDEGAPFPSIHSVKFYLEGPKFTPGVESRLAGACLSGFLEDFRADRRQ
ncbi:hypothetical protein B0H11DRAFT_2048710 [Mycena galericulata]|nr:hypothetical protein B0H11DRAFT_2048710 [Mycena galericulata]